MRADVFRFLLMVLVATSWGARSLAQPLSRDIDNPDVPQWNEENAIPPAFPLEANLREFYVGELTAHSFFVDVSTLGVGKDGVVRYTLVVRTSGGAINITYEGIRCATREYRIYASGGRDGKWAKARLSEWRPIENKPVNRHHAALSRDYFCPVGTPIRSPEEGREALRLGKHPESN